MAGAPTELLARVEIFGDLNRRELKSIASSMKSYHYEAGRNVVTRGDESVGFFVIESGTAAVTVEGEKRRSLGPGDSFGEVAVLGGTPRTATVTAETDLDCWGLTAWAFRPIVEKNGKIAWKLLQALARMLNT
jgi:CRP-like cAMP-binding protein